MLLGEVERVLSAHGVLRKGSDVVLVACSGGVDSVVLAHAAVELLGARRVVVGHVDHAVRESSRDDARFVGDYARELCVQTMMTRLEAGSPSEDRLRELRYDALEKMRAGAGAQLILTAHTEDDQAETVMLGLIRWAQPARLAGMPRRRGAILRPMLGVPRSEVRAYAAAKRLAWREDPTNREPAYLRNRVRKELMPLLERRYRSGIGRRLAKLASALAAPTPASAETTADATAGAIAQSSTGATAPTAGEATAEAIARATDTARAAPTEIRFDRRPWTGDLAGVLSNFFTNLESTEPDSGSLAVFDADVLQAPAIRAIFDQDGRGRLVVTRSDGALVWEPGGAPTGVAPVGPLTRHVWVFWMEQSAQLRGEQRSVTLDHPEARLSIVENDDERRERSVRSEGLERNEE